MPLNDISAQACADLLERVLVAGSAVVVLEAPADAVIAGFTQAMRHSGQSIYLWQPEAGLATLREMHTRVPGSQRFAGALRYIQQSNHFGVYLFRMTELRLNAKDAAQLRQFAQEPSPQIRRIVLLDAPVSLPGQLDDCVQRMAPVRAGRRPRLRDGRWVA